MRNLSVRFILKCFSWLAV